MIINFSSLFSMFEIAPDAWGVFEWGNGGCDKKRFEDPRFLKFAGQFVDMLDMAIDMLGTFLTTSDWMNGRVFVSNNVD